MRPEHLVPPFGSASTIPKWQSAHPEEREPASPTVAWLLPPQLCLSKPRNRSPRGVLLQSFENDDLLKRLQQNPGAATDRSANIPRRVLIFFTNDGIVSSCFIKVWNTEMICSQQRVMPPLRRATCLLLRTARHARLRFSGILE